MKHNPLMLLVLLCAITLASCSSSDEMIVEAEQVSAKHITISTKLIETEILDLINDYRIDNGFSVISELNIIKTQTHEHTNYMINTNAVSHDNFYKRQDYLQQNADAITVGENVAYGYSSAKSVVNAWLKSEKHRKNIEGDFNYFDVSAEQNADGKWYYTNIFLKR